MKPGDIDGDANEDNIEQTLADKPLRRKRSRGSPALATEVHLIQKLCICILTASADKHSFGFQRGEIEDPDYMAEWPIGSECMVGAVLFRWQHFLTANIHDLPLECRQLCRDAQDLLRGPVSGFIVYFAVEHAVVEEWHEVDSGAPHIVRQAAGRVQWCEASHSADPRPPWTSFNDVLRHWQTDHRCAHFQTTSARMHPYIACQTLEWQSAPIHAVALPLNRLPPPRRLFGGHPQQAALRQASASSSAQGPALSTRQLRAGELSAEEYIEFLAASSLTCSIRAMPKSSKVWTDIIKRRSHLDTLDVPKTPSYDVLRRTRIRFDITLMLAFRLWFQNLISSGVPFSCSYTWMPALSGGAANFLLQASTLCGLWTANDFTLDTFSL